MRHIGRLMLTTCAVGLASAVLGAGVSASTLAIYEQPFALTWRSLSFESSGRTVSCRVTLQGSFSSTSFSKSVGRVGVVNRASLESCTGGTATVLTEGLPWTLSYRSFAGTLPEISSVSLGIVGLAVQAASGGITCLARSTEESPFVVNMDRETIGAISEVAVDEAHTIPLGGEFLCRLAGSARVSGRGAAAARPEPREELELMLMLGEVGTALFEEVNGETQDPVPNILIRSPAVEGTELLEDRLHDRRLKLISVALVGANSERFRLVEETNACRREFVLLASRVNACNVRVQYTGTERPKEVRVRIAYLWGIIFWAYSAQEYLVRAE